MDGRWGGTDWQEGDTLDYRLHPILGGGSFSAGNTVGWSLNGIKLVKFWYCTGSSLARKRYGCYFWKIFDLKVLPTHNSMHRKLSPATQAPLYYIILDKNLLNSTLSDLCYLLQQRNYPKAAKVCAIKLNNARKRVIIICLNTKKLSYPTSNAKLRKSHWDSWIIITLTKIIVHGVLNSKYTFFSFSNLTNLLSIY